MSSGLSRGFDLAIPSNRFVLFLTPLVGAIAGLVTLLVGDGWGAAIGNGFSAGGAAFLAWALARELHPDRPFLAGVAFLAAPWGLLVARPDLLVTGVILITARIVAGTTGRNVRWIDLLWVSTLAALAIGRSAAPPTLAVGAVAVMLTATVTRGDRRPTLLLALVVAGLAAAAPTVSGAVLDPTVTPILLAGVTAALVALVGPRRVTTGPDTPGGSIGAGRVRAARLVTMVAAGAAALTADPAVVMPVWAALAATALRPT